MRVEIEPGPALCAVCRRGALAGVSVYQTAEPDQRGRVRRPRWLCREHGGSWNIPVLEVTPKWIERVLCQPGVFLASSSPLEVGYRFEVQFAGGGEAVGAVTRAATAEEYLRYSMAVSDLSEEETRAEMVDPFKNFYEVMFD